MQGYKGGLLLAVVLSFGLFGAGCEATREGGLSSVKGMVAQVKEGMTPEDVKKLFGEPTEVVIGEKGDDKNPSKIDPKDSTLWRYKNKDKFYELWVRFYKGKATWAMPYDKDSTLNTG